MAIRGRKPKPTAVKRLAGNPGKRPLNEDEPKPSAGAPDMPEHIALDERAVEAWEWLCGVLDEMGILAKSDKALMTLYCDAWSQYVMVREQLAPVGAAQFVLRGRTGSFYRNPLIDTESMIRKQLMSYLSELGLSATSRARIHTTRKTDDPDEKSGFLGMVG